MPNRKDINMLSAEELDNYVHALSVLRARPSTDPRSYAHQAAIHNDGEVGPCEHGNDQFFAWHRCHLYYFEQLLQAADPPRTKDVTIPYWDWSRPDDKGNRYPIAFFHPGLADPERFTDGEPLPLNTLSITVNTPDWNQFGGWPKGTPDNNYGDFELGPHNTMHTHYIGGKMGDPATAAEDPIYWSFHCFIDLLWDEWQRRNPGVPATSPDADLRGFLEQPMHKVRDFQDVIALSYAYDHTTALRDALQAAQKPPSDGTIAARRALDALFTRSLPQQLATESRAAFALPMVEQAKRLVVRLEELKIPTVGSYTLRAYVHPRKVRTDQLSPSALQQYEAGYVSLWKAHMDHSGHDRHGGHGQAHHPASAFLRIDVTDAVARLAPSNVSDAVFTLWFEPAPRAAGGPPPRDELLAEMSLRDVRLEEYR